MASNSDVAVQVARGARAADRTVPTEQGADPRATRVVGRLLTRAAATVAVTVTLFLAYLEMARGNGVNADGASNAMQAWDMLHGNVLLRGWTVTDVSFYTNELLLYAAVEVVYGYHADTVHVVAALTYTLLVLLVAAVAKGRATGREAVIRMGVAVAIVGVPTLGLGTSVLLSSPDHTGTGIPLLLTWLVLDRALARRDGSPFTGRQAWLPYVLAVMLAWGQIADPLVMYVGALPLIVVGALRLLRDRDWRPRDWRGPDARLIVAGFGSVVLAQGSLLAIRLVGGFGAHPPPVEFSPLSDLPSHLWITVQAVAGNFGAFFPDRHGAVAVAIGVLHLVGLLAVLATVAVAAVRAVRRRPGRHDDLVTELVAAGILVNLGAFVVSTLPGDLGTARQIVAVLPLGAVLVARICGPRLAALPRSVAPALAAVLLVLAGELAVQSTVRPVPAEGQEVAEWLDAQGLGYGIGAYWHSNNITLITSGRVRVAPVVGGDEIRGYRWESRADWYDPARRDARFLVIDRWHPDHGTEAQAIAQFGQPVARRDFARATVLVYDHNLLVGLPADCVPGHAPAMAHCPRHRFPLVP